MAGTVISANYPPHIDPTKAPIAYGDRALPRMNRELQSESLMVKQRAVMSLCDYLHDPEHIATALREGIVPSLRKLLYDRDIIIRHKTTECFQILSSHAIGRDAILEQKVIEPLSKLFIDSEAIARKNAHLAIKTMAETPLGAEGVVEADLVPVLVEKLDFELDEIKLYILDTLHFCLRVNTEHALGSQAMEIFTKLLEHQSEVVRAKAARDIMDLSMPLAGKDKAVEVKCMPILVRLLRDPFPDVRANAAGAIMTITITTKGKYTALDAEAIQPLVDLVFDPTSEVRLNALKALTTLSEAPEGRQMLLNHVERIQAKCEDPLPAVAKAANIAVKVITWKP